MPTPMPTWDGVTYADSRGLPTFRTGDPDPDDSNHCGDGERNQAGEHCDGADDAACPGLCQSDCTCPGIGVCGDGFVNQVSEDCDGADDVACPGNCDADCDCGILPVCGDDVVNEADEVCDGADDAACPGDCQADCTCLGGTTTTTTTTSTTTTTTLPPVVTLLADARTEAKSPTRNFGTSSILSADADSAKHTFLRFSISGLSGPPASAILRLTATSDSDARSNTGGRVRRIAGCSWGETSITFNNQPSLTAVGAISPALGPVSPGQVVQFDVTSLIPGNGTWCFVITSDSADGVDYRSREAISGRPVLLLNGGGPSSTTTLPTSTTTTTTTALPTTTTAPPTTTTTTTAAPTTTTTTTLPGGGVVTQILADVRTEEDSANTNFGTQSTLAADADSVKNTFIRVSVSGLSGPPSSAILRLTVPNVSRAESNSGGRVRRIAACSWNETSVTFNNQPSLTPVGAVGPAMGPVARGQTVQFNVTSLIPGNGTFCLALTSDSSDGVDYNSREASSGRPQLVVTP
jgi:hypothetical protein